MDHVRRIITKEIRGIKNRCCRAELGKMLFEEMGLDATLIYGKSKLPNDIGNQILGKSASILFLIMTGVYIYELAHSISE